MANKYNMHPQTVQEDATEQRLDTLRQIQKQQQQHHHHHQQQQQQHHLQHYTNSPNQYSVQSLNCSANFFPKAYTNIAVHGLRVKSKLNPMAEEFYPSYMRAAKNGYTTSINNMMRDVNYDYEATNWPGYEYDNRYLSSGKYVHGMIQRSNTVLPLVRQACSGSGSGAADSRSTSFQEPLSIGELDKRRSFSRSISSVNSCYRIQDHSKSNGEVWLIDKNPATDKRMETNKAKKSGQLWTYGEKTTDISSKEEFFEVQCDSKDSGEEEYKEPTVVVDIKPKEKIRPEGGTTENKIGAFVKKTGLPQKFDSAQKKKLIMLYPSKKQQHNDIAQSSQESVFEQPNPIAYTSDESFLTRSDSVSILNEDVKKIIKEGKQFYSKDAYPPVDDVETKVQEISEDFEPTTKYSDSRSSESTESVSSKSVLEQREKPQKIEKCSRPTEIKMAKKSDMEKKTFTKTTTVATTATTATTTSTLTSVSSPTRKFQKNDYVGKDVIPSKLSTNNKDLKELREPKSSSLPKSKQLPATTPTIAKEDLKASNKIARVGVTNSTDEPRTLTRLRNTTTTPYATPKVSVAGAIPKQKEIPSKLSNKPLSTGAVPKIRDPAVKATRKLSASADDPLPKTTTRTLQPKERTTKKEDPKIDLLNQRLPNGFTAQRTQIPTTVAIVDGGNSTFVKPKSPRKEHTLKSSVRSRSPGGKIAKENDQQLKAGSNSPQKKISTPVAETVVKERIVPKSIVKTQMRSATTLRPPSPKKHNSSYSTIKKESESKKAKITADTRNGQAATAKASKTISAKIPVRQKSASLKGVKGVISSDGDNNMKIKTSKSCISLMDGGKKSHNKIIEKKSTNVKPKTSPPRETASTSLRHSQAEKSI